MKWVVSRRTLIFTVISSLVITAIGSLQSDPEELVTAPLQDVTDSVVRVEGVTRSGRGDYFVTESDDRSVVGFKFTNQGGNRILTHRADNSGSGPTRQFQFRFRDRARQDIRFSITDAPTDLLSDLMESYFYFFPRKVIPAIQWPKEASSKTFTVVLPTEERVEFDQETKTIVGGPLHEDAPVDLSRDRSNRKYATVSYAGTGVYVRVDARGRDPRIGTTAAVYSAEKTCRVPSSDLFDQNENSAVVFLFPRDEAFNEYLKKKCGISFLR